MRWILVAIIGFIGIYTTANLFLRKEDPAHQPYAESQIRGGFELREVGWDPFPNAYGMVADSEALSKLPVKFEQLSLRPISFEVLDRQDERVSAWSGRIPPLGQGEQLSLVEASAIVKPGHPYVARLTWEAPEDFQSPQLVVFRQQNRILIVPRPPGRIDTGSSTQTLFIIPPESIEPGTYEVFLSTEGVVNQWIFEAE